MLLLDEIEKAHPDVFNILLQVLDEGHITDNYGRKIDFKNTVVIMTSNIGARRIMGSRALGFQKPTEGARFEQIEEAVKDEINKTFNPEFLNRLDEVIVFHPLNEDHIIQIVDICFATSEADRGARARPELSSEAKKFLAQKYSTRSLVRVTSGAMQRYMEDPFSEALLQGRFAPATKSWSRLRTQTTSSSPFALPRLRCRRNRFRRGAVGHRMSQISMTRH